MPTGTVKWFNNAKGYGFILPEDDDSDVFAHYSAIEMDGYKTLKAGQRVDFELVDGDKGKHAARITLLKGAADSGSSDTEGKAQSGSDEVPASATG
ncbi:MAG: cold shock domain-containing protein CspD [Pseudomonadales bacterium]